jgi:hypothetical protein
MIAGHTRLLSLASLLRSRRTPLHVSSILYPPYFKARKKVLTEKFFAGLQTPKLKRLAEIVSAQALQQQERQEDIHTNGNGYPDGPQGLAIENVDGAGL